MSGGPKGGGGPLLAWACIMVALGTMLAIWSGGSITSLLFLVGAIPLTLLSAWNRARPAPGGPRLLARVSMPVVVTALGAALLAVGLTGGLWLSLIGGEVALLGLVWLGREIVLERRAVRR
ncbi:MAG TPA: hypothetical protein VHV53_07720 [Solirubrobacterales bacterium]|nr:hypothetical protein [Solirubrobacterales bacterium]